MNYIFFFSFVLSRSLSTIDFDTCISDFLHMLIMYKSGLGLSCLYMLIKFKVCSGTILFVQANFVWVCSGTILFAHANSV